MVAHCEQVLSMLHLHSISYLRPDTKLSKYSGHKQQSLFSGIYFITH